MFLEIETKCKQQDCGLATKATTNSSFSSFISLIVPAFGFFNGVIYCIMLCALHGAPMRTAP